MSFLSFVNDIVRNPSQHQLKQDLSEENEDRQPQPKCSAKSLSMSTALCPLHGIELNEESENQGTNSFPTKRKCVSFTTPALLERKNRIHFNELAFWIIYFDCENFVQNWTLSKDLLNQEKLKGIFEISFPKDHKTHPKGIPEHPIFFSCGPLSDKNALKEAGENIVALLKHKKQKCNFNYEKKIVCKPYKKERKGEVICTVNY
jgi:hypothetical protein